MKFGDDKLYSFLSFIIVSPKHSSPRQEPMHNTILASPQIVNTIKKSHQNTGNIDNEGNTRKRVSINDITVILFISTTSGGFPRFTGPF